MATSEKLKKMGLDKLAFLILLLLGLLIARIFISSRTSFQLSQSVTLKGTGLEVSMPDSQKWKWLSNDFKFESNEFRLSAVLRISADSAISAIWRYSLLTSRIDPNQRFTQLAASLPGHIVKSGTDDFGQMTFDYAIIESENAALFIAAAVLPNARILTLEIVQQGTGYELAEKLFRAMLASAKYNSDNSFVRGVIFLEEFKKSFLTQLPDSELSQGSLADYYRIKDAGGNIIGFTTDTISYIEDDENNLPLTASTLLFFSPSHETFAEQTVFNSDIELNAFDWITNQGNMMTSRQQQTIIHLRAGVLTVEKSGRFEQLPFSEIMLPYALFDLAVAQFLKSGFETIYIEVLLADARVSPVILSRIKSTQTAALPERSAAQADFFGTINSTQKLYYDGRGRLVSADVAGNLTYRLERTARASIIADFPQWLDKIQQMEMLQNKSKKRK